jgi:hypothetical protein
VSVDKTLSFDRRDSDRGSTGNSYHRVLGNMSMFFEVLPWLLFRYSFLILEAMPRFTVRVELHGGGKRIRNVRRLTQGDGKAQIP